MRVARKTWLGLGFFKRKKIRRELLEYERAHSIDLYLNEKRDLLYSTLFVTVKTESEEEMISFRSFLVNLAKTFKIDGAREWLDV